LSTFIIGTGNSVASSPPSYRYNGIPASTAAARAAAIDTPGIAFAPNRLLAVRAIQRHQLLIELALPRRVKTLHQHQRSRR
jgi:hypothetical protein